MEGLKILEECVAILGKGGAVGALLKRTVPGISENECVRLEVVDMTGGVCATGRW